MRQNTDNELLYSTHRPLAFSKRNFIALYC